MPAARSKTPCYRLRVKCTPRRLSWAQVFSLVLGLIGPAEFGASAHAQASNEPALAPSVQAAEVSPSETVAEAYDGPQRSAPGVGDHNATPGRPTGLPSLPKVGLQQALTQSLQRNPNIQLALETIKRAEALITEARSYWLPNVVGNGSYTRLDHDRAVAGRVLMYKNAENLNLLATVPLLSAQRWVQTRQAKDVAEAARLDAVEIRRQLALSTAHAYLQVIAQRRVIDVNQRALQNNRDHYLYAHTRYTGGIGNQLDDTRAAQEVASSEATLEQSLAALNQAQEALGVLLGADGPLDTEDEFTLHELPQPDPEAVPERGDVMASRRREQNARRFVKDRWADWMPSLNATFQPFYQHRPTPQYPTFGWQAQFVLAVPLIQGGLRIGLNREREALLAQSRAQLEGVVRQAKSDVRVAMTAVQRADAAYLSAARAAELSQEALKMANIAYHAGATTNIEVIDAERRARDAETNAVIAEDAARRARLDLLSATGRLP
jgi:outer membrane protein TolC